MTSFNFLSLNQNRCKKKEVIDSTFYLLNYFTLTQQLALQFEENIPPLENNKNIIYNNL